MKINLLNHGSDIRNGYVNVDHTADLPKNLTFAEEKRIGSIKNINWLCKDGEADEIIAIDSPMSFEFKEIPSVVTHWVQKLKPGGVLIVGGNDAYEACKAFELGSISLQTLTDILFGENQRSALMQEQITEIFINLGLKILKKEIQNYKFVVIGAK